MDLGAERWGGGRGGIQSSFVVDEEGVKIHRMLSRERWRQS
jgi:hypothetical protein